MKQYFAKYLPVEGKLKEGELGWSINNALYTHYDHLGENYGKPIKLFLCSREIQIGDTLRFIEDNTDLLTSTEKELKQHQLLIKLDKGVKVVGEISSEATWVKQGNEFEHDELCLNGIGQNWDSRTPLSGKNIVFIKGPCGHYH